MATKQGSLSLMQKRVAEARETAGYSLSEATKLLGFNNYQTLSAIERGTRNINANELSAVARLYGRSLDYFFEEEVFPDPVPLWRKLADADEKRVQRHFISFLESYSKVENLLSLKRRWKGIQKSYERTDFLHRGFELADRLGAEIGDFLWLGSRPASSLLNVLENDLRVKILHLPLENGISGASVVDEHLGAGMLINANDVPWRRSFDLAHELFHIVTWNVFNRGEVGDGTVKTRPEQFADAFASSLLLPQEHLLTALEEVTINKTIRLVDIIELSKDFEVSTDAISWRLVNLKVLKKEQVQKIIQHPKRKELDRTLRRCLLTAGAVNKYPERYISLCCRCLMEGKISRGVFAKYMEINRADVDSYLNKFGYQENNYEEIASA
ncbi:MAG: ImmA/IrrE family metallo-endopeptidase [Deltaproteobacteria bacterium]|nr:ImmA/IrrE family metallo-endopeptidase [Deltaproteobacteria bacterium]